MPDAQGKPLPGEWWETRDGTRAFVAASLSDVRFLPEDEDCYLTGWLLNESGKEAISFSWSAKGEYYSSGNDSNDLVKHLPDCTGWDWQPPDWVELDPVNYGWHGLRCGIDQCRHKTREQFKPVEYYCLTNWLIKKKKGNWEFRCLRKDLPVKPAEPVKSRLNLEVGKRYVRRDGLVSGSLKASEDFAIKGTHPWEDSTCGCTYTSFGKWSASDKTESSVDLIAEYIEPVKPDTGKGWRLLEPAEFVFEGDEMLHKKDPEGWELSDNWRVGGKQSETFWYRRKTPAPTWMPTEEDKIKLWGAIHALNTSVGQIQKQLGEQAAKDKFFESVM